MLARTMLARTMLARTMLARTMRRPRTMLARTIAGPDDAGSGDPSPAHPDRGDRHPGNPDPGNRSPGNPDPGNPDPGNLGRGNPGPGWPAGPELPSGPWDGSGDPPGGAARDPDDEPCDVPSGPADHEDVPAAQGAPPSWPDLPLPGDVPAPGCAPSWPGNRGSPLTKPQARLTVTVPWRTLAGLSGEPGNLCWLGPVTPLTAQMLARTAATDPTCDWRVIVTGRGGQAIAVTRVRRSRGRRSGAASGLIGRITLTIPTWILDGTSAPALSELDSLGSLGEVLARAWKAALDAAREAASRASSDWQPTGTCAHLRASPSYRPPDRLHEFIVARDQTCRFPRCRQPAWRGDLDHTIPYGDDGPTCRCNLGALCRTHHRLKQRLRWHLEQPSPGVLVWTTPAGRRYTATPDPHAA